MLPTETFADAVAFLRLFDLRELVVANALCSSLAVRASTKIRWEKFPGLRFYIYAHKIEVFRTIDAPMDEATPYCGQLVAILNFSGENELAEFVAAAFLNCIFEDVFTFWRGSHLLDALGQVADSVIVKGSLCLPCRLSPDESLRLVRKFRKVKKLRLDFVPKLSEEEVNNSANFYGGSGIEELWCRYQNDATPKKLAAF